MNARVDPDALALAADEARRTVNEARLVLERLQQRLDGVLRVGIAEAAGLIAVGALLLDRPLAPSPIGSLVLLGGVLIGFAGMAVASQALSGVSADQWLEIGAQPRTLRLRLQEPDADRDTLQWTLLGLMHDQVVSMRIKGRRLSVALTLGTWSLVASAVFYLVALGLIITEGFHG